jgi:hypothetical protein
MSYAAIMAGVGAKYRSYTQRVHTKFQSNGLSDPNSAVEVLSRKRKIQKDGSVVLTYTFEDGKQVKVTYQDM